ncbi:MAG: hypothetical protein KIS88_01465 [Anaerolineales bacterium]|nr:hypothetical protein [Anaerolineales bacterium]
MKRLLTILLLTTLLAACASAPSADDAAVQTAVAALLTQQAPAPEETAEAPADEPPADTGGVATSAAPPQGDELPGLPAEASCVPLGTERVYATVLQVTKGDAALMQVGDKVFDVRYIGIDDGDNPQSIEANRAMVEGKRVALVRDVTDVDEYGRLVRYVIVDDAFVNLRLLQQRVVYVSIEPPDTACERLFNSVP